MDGGPFAWQALVLSLQVSLTATLFCIPPGIYLAWILARRQFPGKNILDGLLHLPLVLPPVVVGYLLLIMFGRNGWLGALLFDWTGMRLIFSWQGAALAAGVMAFPLFVRAVRLSIETADPRLETVARTLGAGPLRVFFTISLPLILPGILAGSVLAFARAFGEFGATITFAANIPGETQTLPLAIYSALQTPNGDAIAFRLAMISIAVALLAMIGSEWLAARVKRQFGAS